MKRSIALFLKPAYRVLFALLFFLTCFSVEGNAECTISPSSDEGGNTQSNLGNSFTACETGTLLKLRVFHASNYTGRELTIYDGGSPGGTVLGTVTGISLHTATAWDDWSEVDLSSENISVTSGGQYTFFFSGVNEVNIAFSSNNNVSGGQIYDCDGDGTNCLTDANWDLRFEMDIGPGSSNAAPVIATTGDDVAYTENEEALQMDGTATVSDPDGDADWNTGTLTVQITANSEAADELSINDTDGNGPTITLIGADILADGTDVGDLSVSGGVVTGGTALTVTFNAVATNTIVQEVLQSMRYRNTSDAPGTSDRTVTFTATDAQAGTTSDTVILVISATPDDPSIAITVDNVPYTENGVALQMDNAATMSDPDADWDGSTLTVQITDNSEAADELSIADSDSDDITIDGTNIKAGVTTVGTLSVSGGVVTGGTALTVTFNADATNAIVQEVMQSMQYRNSSDAPSTSNRTVTFTATDAQAGTTSDTVILVISATPDDPSIAITVDNVPYTENGVALQMDNAATMSDPDADWDGSTLTVQITDNSEAADELSINDTDGNGPAITLSGTDILADLADVGDLSVSGGVVTGGTALTVTFNAAATNDIVQEVLQSMLYRNTSDAPGTSRTVTFTATDAQAGTASDTVTLVISATPDDPSIAITDVNVLYTENGIALRMDSAATVSDPDADWDGSTLTVQITTNGEVADELSINDTDGDGIDIAIDDTNIKAGVTTVGTLSVSGGVVTGGTALTVTFNAAATNDIVQEVLQSMRYRNTSDAPSTSNRTVTFTATDTQAGTDRDTVILVISATPDDPSIAITDVNVPYTENGVALQMDNAATMSDPDADWDGSTLTVQITTNGEVADELSINDTDGDGIDIAIDDTNIKAGVTTVGTLSVSGGVVTGGTALTVTFDADATNAIVQEVLQSMRYRNTSDAPSTLNRTVTFTATDAQAGTGSDTVTLVISATNDDPSISTTDDDVAYTENGDTLQMDSTATVSDADGNADWNTGTLTVQITTNGEAADELSINDTDGNGPAITLIGTDILADLTDVGDLSVSGGVVTGGTALTVTFNAAATNAIVQEVLQSMRYRNTSDAPSTSNRTVTFTATDAQAGTGSDTVTLVISATNDNPTASNFTASPVYQNTIYAFETADFSYVDDDGDLLDHLRVVIKPDAGSLWVDIDGQNDLNETPLANEDSVSKADLDDGKLKYLSPDGTSSSFVFVVNDGTEDSSGSYTATVTVIAEPSVTLTLDPVSSILESGAVTSVKATLSHAFDKDVTVDLSTTGTAISGGVDYTLSSSSIVVTTGSTSGTVTVTGVDDTLEEEDETVIFDISSVTHGVESGVQQVTCFVNDDDELAWIGLGTNTLWSNTANWNAGRLPVDSEIVEISGAFDITLDGELTLGGLVLLAGATGTFNQGDWPLTINGDLELSGGTFIGGTEPIDLSGSFVQSGGTFVSTEDALQVGGDFLRTGGTFDPNGGAVIFDGGDQSITGSTTFYSLIKEPTVDSVLTFEAGETQTVNGVLKLVGKDNARLTLASSVPGTQWSVNPTGTVILDTLEISDCNNSATSEISCGNSIDDGNNVAVVFSQGQPPRATLVNHPTYVTNVLVSTLSVGGIGVTHYMFRLGDDHWSAERSVAEPLTCELDDDGVATLYVTGKNVAGLWQREDEASVLTWIVDRSAPVVSFLNPPSGTMGTTAAEIAVGGDGVVLYKYALDSATFSNVRPVSRVIELSGLTDGVHILTAIGVDQAGNWQEEAGATEVNWTVDTDVPTAVLGQLPPAVTRDTTASISVAVENADAEIDRYAYTMDDGTTWIEGVQSDPIELSGLAEGEHTLKVNASRGGMWQDGVDGRDNVTSATTWTWRVDLTPPDQPVLFASEGAPASTSVSLSMNIGEPIRRYRLWYGKGAITEATLGEATELFSGLTLPSEGNHTLLVKGLSPGQTYAFAGKFVDTAGHVSALSDSVIGTTVSLLPTITGFALAGGGVTGDNSKTRSLDITGTHFLASEGLNIVCFESSRRAFSLPSETGDTSTIHVNIRSGAPPGIYNLRVVNKHGISRVTGSAYTIAEAPQPVPSVTSVNPVVVPTGTPTEVTISGAHFGASIASVNLLSADGAVIPLWDVVRETDGLITAEVDVASSFEEGLYWVQVVNTDGRKNEISGVQMELCKPVDLSLESGGMVTTRMVQPMDAMIPVKTILATDDRDEVGSVQAIKAKIRVTFEAGTILEGQDVVGAWNDYDGLVNPPRQVPITEAVENSLGPGSVIFTMGSEGFLRLKNGETLFAEVEISLEDGAPVPSIYYVGLDGEISLAGVPGTLNGVAIVPGGTILVTRLGVPEVGFVTYTFGIFLDHMSTYAAGVKVADPPPEGPDDSDSDDSDVSDASDDSDNSGGGFGPCFIGSVSAYSWGAFVGGLCLLAIFCTGGLMSKRFFFIGVFVAVVLAMASPWVGYAAEASTVQQAPVQKTVNESPWHLKFGLAFGLIGEEYTAMAGARRYDLDVDNVISPFLRVEYAFTNRLSLEVKAALDLYSGDMETLASSGASSLRGYSLGIGPMVYLGSRYPKRKGGWRPFLYASGTYRDVKDDLRFPVKSFHSTVGAEAGAGFCLGLVEVRLGYNWTVLDEGKTAAVYSSEGSSNNLDLSAVALEVAWRLPLEF